MADRIDVTTDTQVIVLLEDRRRINRQFPNTDTRPRAPETMERSLASCSIKVLYLPALDLVTFDRQSEGIRISSIDGYPKLFPGPDWSRMESIRVPKGNKTAVFGVSIAAATIMAVDEWRAWQTLVEAEALAHVQEIHVVAPVMAL